MSGLRIAMWSGPRNISTAMMRAWGHRPDAFVSDEPFYAHYLKVTGLPHPGAEEVIAHHESDWQKVVAYLTGPIPGGKAVWYQKHMCHHMLPMIGLDWLDQVSSAFLIRQPREMLASLINVLGPEVRLEDTGLPQQMALFERVRKLTGRTPPVVDTRDILENPRRTLGALCESLGLQFDERMLSWPAGPRDTDGVWAKHWYASVEATTGFGPYQPKKVEIPQDKRPMLDACESIYEELKRVRLGA